MTTERFISLFGTVLTWLCYGAIGAGCAVIWWAVWREVRGLRQKRRPHYPVIPESHLRRLEARFDAESWNATADEDRRAMGD